MSDGLDLFPHRFVPASGGRTPTLLLLHGTGGDESDLLELGRAVAPGWALLSPRGRVLENGMPRFFRRLAEGVFDEADLRAQTDALARFVRSASERYGFDASRVFALGFSNGANIAASLLLLSPGTLAGAALLRPMALPFQGRGAPVGSDAKPVIVISGAADPIVPRDHPERLAGQLTQAGAKVTVLRLDAGHGLSRGEPALVAAFLAENATPAPAPTASVPATALGQG